MATATASTIPATVRVPRLVVLAAYLVALVTAEVLFALGVAEDFLRRPEGWIASPADLAAFAVGTAVIFTATGISEEIIFRGILLKRAIEGLGERRGLLFVSLAFTAL